MSEKTKADVDEADVDEAAAGLSGAATKRTAPSASAASRARRIGGRPTPGPRPKPTADPSPVPAKQAKAALSKQATKTDQPGDSTTADSTTRRGGLRAARAAATERAAEAAPAVSLDKRAARTTARAANRLVQPEADVLRRKLERVRWIPAGVLAAAVAVLGVLCVALGHGVWWSTTNSSDVRGQVLAAAKTCTAAVSSYDYRHLAQSKKDGLACATGKFRTDYATAMDTIVAKEAPKTKTTQSVQVAKAGVEQVSSDGRQWTLLIYGQHTVTNTTTGTSTPRLDKLSIRVVMDKVGSKWLISKIDLAAS